MHRPPPLDIAIAVGLGVAEVAEAAIEFVPARWNPLALTVLVVSAGALAWRRSAPALVAILSGAGLAAPGVFGASTETLSSSLVLVVGTYSLAVYAPSWRSWPVPLVLLVAAVSFRSAMDYGYEPFTVVVGVAWTAAAFGVGAAMRFEHRRTRASERRAVLAEQQAAAAVAAERARIARDLHDVVAHAISVIVLQARGGRRMLALDPPEARLAFDTVEHIAGQAMVEMRRLLGLLHTDGSEAQLAPQPSLRQLDELVARVQGPRVTTRISGELAALPEGVDLAAYRVVQEALTNVMKHADARAVAVTVAITPATLELEVADDGVGGGRAAGGFGLIGMRERVQLYGGTLDTGAAPGGGFRVRACLPLTAVPA